MARVCFCCGRPKVGQRLTTPRISTKMAANAAGMETYGQRAHQEESLRSQNMIPRSPTRAAVGFAVGAGPSAIRRYASAVARLLGVPGVREDSGSSHHLRQICKKKNVPGHAPAHIRRAPVPPCMLVSAIRRGRGTWAFRLALAMFVCALANLPRPPPARPCWRVRLQHVPARGLKERTSTTPRWGHPRLRACSEWSPSWQRCKRASSRRHSERQRSGRFSAFWSFVPSRRRNQEHGGRVRPPRSWGRGFRSECWTVCMCAPLRRSELRSSAIRNKFKPER